MDQNYFKIRINSLHPKRAITFDLFIHLNNHFILYLREGSSLEEKKISCMDMVELCPPYDNGATASLAAKLMSEVIAMNISH